jgi:uncharacterized damage-inducible protein DinB
VHKADATRGRLVSESIAPFYADWAGYNRRTVATVRAMSEDDLALRVAGSNHWPIWAIASHMAVTRVFWLCHVLKEPGAETTPFTDPSGYGWEDDLAMVRTGTEVADAYEASWRIVAGCLERWTPTMLGETFRRDDRTRWEVHSRQSILLRLITHEAYHVGEISLTLGANGRSPIDLWPGAEWAEDASRA